MKPTTIIYLKSFTHFQKNIKNIFIRIIPNHSNNAIIFCFVGVTERTPGGAISWGVYNNRIIPLKFNLSGTLIILNKINARRINSKIVPTPENKDSINKYLILIDWLILSLYAVIN